MTEVIETKFIVETPRGLLKKPVTMEYRDGRIYFIKSPFESKDDIKSMKGSKWHGFEDPPLKQWSVKDCMRNRVQIEWLEGGNPFAHFEQPVKQFVPDGYTRKHLSSDTPREIWDVQKRMINSGLTYHYQIIAGCMGSGKTVSAIEIMERSKVKKWWWVGPKATLIEITLQFQDWGLDESIEIELMTYDKLKSIMDSGEVNIPQAVVFDEASKLKSEGVGRTEAAQQLADMIRAKHGLNGYVLLMSGTPSPKSPIDIWALAEIAWPGFLREGSPKALEQRVAVLKPVEKAGGISSFYNERVAWLDREGLCRKCGKMKDECFDLQAMGESDPHDYTPAINEVANINTRLQGLLTTVFKHECPKLPGKQYIEINLPPSPKLMKVAGAITRTANSTMQALTQLRQLSDGFLYREGTDGDMTCPTCHGSGEIDEWFNPVEPDRPYHSIELMDPEKTKNFEKRRVTCTHCEGKKVVPRIVRDTVPCPCPKLDIVSDLLDKAANDTGRIIIFAGLQGSVDRLVSLANEQGWTVFRCDGKGQVVIGPDGKQIPDVVPLQYWRDMGNKQVAFIANPESGGLGLTLVEADIEIFYSNSFKPEFRVQAEERADRPGQTRLVKVYDLLHLPSDKRTLDIIRDNRRLENMVLGDVLGDCFK